MRKWLSVLGLIIFFTLTILSLSGFFNNSQFGNVDLVGNAKTTFGLLANDNDEQITNSQPTSTSEIVDSDDGVLVSKVIDGDTIEIEGGMKVRYIGIDTPETSHPTKGVQCFGRQATERNRQLVEGKKVILEKDISETDKYGRLLRYIWIRSTGSGQADLVNEILVKEGFAFSSSYPPDIKYQERFRQAEIQARGSNKGLWGQCGFARLTNGQVVGQANTILDGDCLIKGNISSSGEKIYHMPGQRYYNQTAITESKGERWFCSEEEAQKAGWRKSRI